MQNDSILKTLNSLEQGERLSCFRNYVKNIFCTFLHIDNHEELVTGASFFEQGLSSLGVIEIQQTLEKVLSIKINPAVLFNHPTIDSLIQFLMSELSSLFGAQKEMIKTEANEEVDYARQILKMKFNL